MEAKRFFLNPHLFIKIGAKSKSRSRTSRWQWLRSMPWTSPPELWIKPMNKQFVKLYKHLSRKLCESWTGLALRWEKCKGNRRADRIIWYRCLCNFENLPRSGDVCFMNAKDLLYLSTILDESLMQESLSLFFPEKKANGSIWDCEGPMRSSLKLPISLPGTVKGPAWPSRQQPPTPSRQPRHLLQDCQSSCMIALHLVPDFLTSCSALSSVLPPSVSLMGIFNTEGDSSEQLLVRADI